MVPEVRALADRFIYDTSTIKYMATNAIVGALDRVAPGPGWTVREVFAHLAGNQDRYADTIARWLAGEPGLTLPGDAHEANTTTAEGNVATPLPEIIELLDRSLREIVQASHQTDEAKAGGLLGGRNAMHVLNEWASHSQSHVIDLITALPEFKTDPMVLGWALQFDFSQEPESAQWQMELARDVHANSHDQGQEEE